ncbi:LLM class flavin-dependent oxidoreductase [Nocardioides sp. Iso805N]|uniref:LLM class flavin-dependent oxidoreductase n=1 Tax=Nocardioides sp. Iso805N TaxID=1283287 RepID=UPI00035C4B45|nr:LLM class flavin-dependent oxidoreductase [Nocardioides sp. Iso805N]
MTSTLQVRRIRREEYDAVAQLTLAAYENDYQLDPDYRERLLDVAGWDRDHQVWVAEDVTSGELLGAVTTPGENGPVGRVARHNDLDFRLLAVAPGARRRGVGRLLVEHVIELARARGRARVVMNSGPQMTGAHALYARLGFRRLHERETHVLDDGRVLYAFALDLDGGAAQEARGLVLAVELGALTRDAAGVRTWVRWAEEEGFALVTFADAPASAPTGVGAAAEVGVDAGTRASYAALLTDRIGLAPTLPVTTAEPFHLATQLASLDHATDGRAGWIVTAPDSTAALATVGSPALTTDQARQEARDAVEVAHRLWDSWQDDAIVKDVATGRFVASDRLHRVDFEGATYDIVGPLITPRPPQGQVVVIADVALGLGDAADIALVPDPDGIERAHASGVARIFADLQVDLDDRPDAAEELAGRLIRLAETVDGVRLHPTSAADLAILAAQVLPRLREAGLHRPPVPGSTLRESLGLRRPANRYAVPA